MALGGEITRGRKRSSRWDWGFGTVVVVDIVLWHPLEVAIHALALIFFFKDNMPTFEFHQQHRRRCNILNVNVQQLGVKADGVFMSTTVHEVKISLTRFLKQHAHTCP